MMTSASHPKRKLYIYLDETGQDTLGRFFLVALVAEEGREDVRTVLILRNMGQTGDGQHFKCRHNLKQENAYQERTTQLAVTTMEKPLVMTDILRQSVYTELDTPLTSNSR